MKDPRASARGSLILLYKFSSRIRSMAESQYVRSAPDRRLKLLRTSQKWLQSFRRAGLRKNYGIYCIYNNDLEVHSYVENT